MTIAQYDALQEVFTHGYKGMEYLNIRPQTLAAIIRRNWISKESDGSVWVSDKGMVALESL